MADGPHTIRLSAHPRASRHIAAAKGWGGLIGFGVVLLLSLKAGSAPFDAGLRALMGGIGLYLLAWFGAVMVWRELAVAEVAAAKRQLIENSIAAQEAAEAARTALAGQQQQAPPDIA